METDRQLFCKWQYVCLSTMNVYLFRCLPFMYVYVYIYSFMCVYMYIYSYKKVVYVNKHVCFQVCFHDFIHGCERMDMHIYYVCKSILVHTCVYILHIAGQDPHVDRRATKL
jgi:hypothetical protein